MTREEQLETALGECRSLIAQDPDDYDPNEAVRLIAKIDCALARVHDPPPPDIADVRNRLQIFARQPIPTGHARRSSARLFPWPVTPSPQSTGSRPT